MLSRPACKLPISSSTHVCVPFFIWKRYKYDQFKPNLTNFPCPRNPCLIPYAPTVNIIIFNPAKTALQLPLKYLIKRITLGSPVYDMGTCKCHRFQPIFIMRFCLCLSMARQGSAQCTATVPIRLFPTPPHQNQSISALTLNGHSFPVV